LMARSHVPKPNACLIFPPSGSKVASRGGEAYDARHRPRPAWEPPPMTMTADRQDRAQSTFALNPQDELNDLRMSDKALPLLNKVRTFIREVVNPMSERFHALDDQKPS